MKAVAGGVSDRLCSSWNPKPFRVYRHSGFLGISPAVIWGYGATPEYLWSRPAAMRLSLGGSGSARGHFSVLMPSHCKPGMFQCCLELTTALYKSQPRSGSTLFQLFAQLFWLSNSLCRQTHRRAIMRSWGRLVWPKRGQARYFSKTVLMVR